jgi:hypothetical protein
MTPTTTARGDALKKTAALITYAQQRVLIDDLDDAAAVLAVAARILAMAARG